MSRTNHIVYNNDGVNGFADLIGFGIVQHEYFTHNYNSDAYTHKLDKLNKKLKKIENNDPEVTKQINTNSRILIDLQDCKSSVKGMFNKSGCFNDNARNVIVAIDDTSKILNKHGIQTKSFYERNKSYIIITVICIFVLIVFITMFTAKYNITVTNTLPSVTSTGSTGPSYVYQSTTN